MHQWPQRGPSNQCPGLSSTIISIPSASAALYTVSPFPPRPGGRRPPSTRAKVLRFGSCMESQGNDSRSRSSTSRSASSEASARGLVKLSVLKSMPPADEEKALGTSCNVSMSQDRPSKYCRGFARARTVVTRGQSRRRKGTMSDRAMYPRVCGKINRTTLWLDVMASERPSSTSRNPSAVPKRLGSTVCCWASGPSKTTQVSSVFAGQENEEDAETLWKTRSIECQEMAFDATLTVLFTWCPHWNRASEPSCPFTAIRPSVPVTASVDSCMMSIP